MFWHKINWYFCLVWISCRKANNINSQLVFRLKSDMVGAPFNKTRAELFLPEKEKSKPLTMSTLLSEQRQMMNAQSRQKMYWEGQTSDKFVEDSLLDGDPDLIIVYQSM